MRPICNIREFSKNEEHLSIKKRDISGSDISERQNPRVFTGI